MFLCSGRGHGCGAIREEWVIGYNVRLLSEHEGPRLVLLMHLLASHHEFRIICWGLIAGWWSSTASTTSTTEVLNTAQHSIEVIHIGQVWITLIVIKWRGSVGAGAGRRYLILFPFHVDLLNEGRYGRFQHNFQLFLHGLLLLLFLRCRTSNRRFHIFRFRI